MNSEEGEYSEEGRNSEEGDDSEEFGNNEEGDDSQQSYWAGASCVGRLFLISLPF